MNKEFKQNLLRTIKDNRIVPIEDTDLHYAYEVRGYKNRLLLRFDFYDGTYPRVTITSMGKQIAHINHFAKTKEQFKHNYDVWHLANKVVEKYRKQNGYIETTMNETEFKISCFLREFSIKRR